MAKTQFEFTNQFNDTLNGLAWVTNNPKANVLILTGMQETSERYNDFANFLNEHNFNVYCIDHYGQGLNVKSESLLGKWPSSGFSKTSKTFGEYAEYLNKSNLPIYIFGHSMGSFVLQDLIQRFPNVTNRVVICGSDFASLALMSVAYKLAKHRCKADGDDTANPKLAKLVTGGFSKAVKNRVTDFDWLSYNRENVEKYIADPLCGFVATGGFYKEFLKGMRRLNKRKFLEKINKNIEVLIIAGAEDPVGHNGKGPTKLYKQYKKLGLKNANLKIYQNMRHEILNEDNKLLVYKDILEFLNK